MTYRPLAINTEYRGATNHKPARIRVQAAQYPAKFYSYDHAYGEYTNHEQAVALYWQQVLNRDPEGYDHKCADNFKANGYVWIVFSL